MPLGTIPWREYRWIGVKIQRRLAAPIKRWRIRRADRRELAAGEHAVAVLPWLLAADATFPGNPARVVWSHVDDGASAWPDYARRVRDHAFTILADQARHVIADDLERLQRVRVLAAELPAHALSAYRPIDWHADFHAGYRWDPSQFYLDVRVAPVVGADIKVPRELSRFQHLGALRGAPRDEAAVEFLLQVLDWICANRLRRGVNWGCTMDVALRAVSWIWGLRLLEPAVIKYPKALGVITGSLRQHGMHIQDNLEYAVEGTNNHYLADICGLLYIAAAFPQFPESDRWLLFALQELVSEMQRQVYPDGGAHEASTHYHRLVGEMFASCAALAERIPFSRRRRLQTVDRGEHKIAPRLRAPARGGLNLGSHGRLLPQVFYSRLARMAELTAALTKPNGLVAQFGDNDSARAHKLLPRAAEEARDHAHLVATVGELTGREDLILAGVRGSEEAFLVAGGLGTSAAAIDARVRLDAREIFFPDSGIAVLRQEPAWLAVTCGPNGQGGRGGHGHNDKLSFELNVHGVDFIVDGGCPAYSGAPAERNRFRSTWAHSTVAVVGMEQDPLPPGQDGLFRLPEDCAPRLTLTAGGTVSGSHSGYGAAHHRRFVLSAGALEIQDVLDLTAERWLLFNLDPAITVVRLSVVEERATCTLVHADGPSIALCVEGASDARVHEGCFGVGYGQPLPTAQLRVRMARATAMTTLTWSR